MLRKLIIGFIVFAATQPGITVGKSPVDPQNFSKSIAIELEPGQAVYELELTEAVYRNIKRDDLGDIRIYNATGYSVPYVIRRTNAKQSTRILKRSVLPFFPLYAEPGKNLDDLAIRINKNRQGSIVDINVRNGGGQQKKNRIAYLVDAVTFKKPLSELQLSWRSTDTDGSLVNLKVEYSNDLSRWNTLNARNVLADLRYQGHRLAQGIVQLKETEAKYFRLSWPADTGKFAIDGITAVYQKKTNDVLEYRWSQIKGKPDPEQKNTFLYDIGGHLPAYRARIVLPVKNSAVKASLHSTNRLTPTETRYSKRKHLLDLSSSSRRKFHPYWRSHMFQQMVYDIDINGARLRSDDVRLSRTTNRYWRVQVNSGEGAIEQTPILELGWLPGKILFLATGEPPYQLLVGNEQARILGSSDRTLIRHMRNKDIQPSRATLGKVVSLQEEDDAGGILGASAFKIWILWFVMVWGVLMLGWMAFRLSKQISDVENND